MLELSAASIVQVIVIIFGIGVALYSLKQSNGKDKKDKKDKTIAFYSTLVAGILLIGMEFIKAKEQQQTDKKTITFQNSEIRQLEQTRSRLEEYNAELKRSLDSIKALTSTINLKTESSIAKGDFIIGEQREQKYSIQELGLECSLTYLVENNRFLKKYLSRIRAKINALEQDSPNKYLLMQELEKKGILLSYPSGKDGTLSPAVITVTSSAASEWLPDPQQEPEAHYTLNRLPMQVFFTKKSATEKTMPSLTGGKVSRIYQLQAINPIIAPQVPRENFQYLGAASNSLIELLISNHDDYVTQSVRTNNAAISEGQQNIASITALQGTTLEIVPEYFGTRLPELAFLNLYFAPGYKQKVEIPITKMTQASWSTSKITYSFWRYVFPKQKMLLK